MPIVQGHSGLFRSPWERTAVGAIVAHADGFYLRPMVVRAPQPRRSGPLTRLWLAPTNAVGHVVARLVGAAGPFEVGSACAPAQYYVLPDSFPWWFGAVSLGHVILLQESFASGPRGRWTMAHELSHTRQHDWLGPFYLPLHGCLQLVSFLIALVRPLPGYSAVHAYNPLERAFLCVPFDYLVELRRGRVPEESERAVLSAFGVEAFECRVPAAPPS